MEYKYLKEVVKDLSLGNLLLIHFNPPKVCSFNCVFCSLGQTTRLLMEREMFCTPEEILSEVEEYIKEDGEPDYVWLFGDGEPALYLGFKQLTSQIIMKYPKIKIRVSSNGSLLYREDVRDEFLLCDLVTINLNTLNPEEYLKISRHHKDVKLKSIIQGLRLFREQFRGDLWISTVFVKDINDNEVNVQNLKSFLLEINPDFYFIRGFSKKEEESLSEEFKKYVKQTFKDVKFKVKNGL